MKTDFLPEKAGVLLRENLKEILIDAWELTPIPLSSLLKNILWGKRKFIIIYHEPETLIKDLNVSHIIGSTTLKMSSLSEKPSKFVVS